MSKLISIGEALIDFIPAESGIGLKNTKSFSPIVGGAPLNVAVTVGKLGGESLFLSKVGEDAFGDKILEVLKKFNVDTSNIKKTNTANTGLAFVSLAEDGNREFSFYRNPSADMLLDKEEVEDIFNKGDIIHFCSVSLIDAPIKKAHKRALDFAEKSESIISFDPNVRLPLWNSREECRNTILEFIPRANILKISDEELEFITGIKDEEKALDSLFVGNVKILLYTKGKDGVEFITKNKKVKKIGFSVKAIDTTGAGDSFIGSFLYTILRYKYSIEDLENESDIKIKEFLNFSNAVGALTVQKKGGAEAVPTLKEVENFLRENLTDDLYRSAYHIMPPTGWINDPVGLSYFNGNYNVYYQYAPFDVLGGIKFWGHYRGKNLFNGEHLDIAIEPSINEDIDGIYSGSILTENNNIYAFYTGNVKNKGDYDYINKGREQNLILAKSKDGIKFEEKKVILTNKDYPDNLTLHVRDPKVWKDDNEYFIVLGARNEKDKGEIILYKSKDLYKWDFVNSILDENIDLGYMFECPDLFKLNNIDILMFSPQGIKEEEILYNNKYQSGYLLGEFSKEKGKFIPKSTFVELDRGFDFYAPQTFMDNKNRRILIGWMGISEEDRYYNPTIEKGWNHQLTLPRELKIIENKLYQLPLEEIKELRKEHKELKELKFNEKASLEILNSKSFELEIDFKEIKSNLEIDIRGAKLKYNLKDRTFELNLEEIDTGRDKRLCKLEKLEKLRVFSDTSSLEIFINNGEEVFTTRLFIEEYYLLEIIGDLNLDIDYWRY